jgi:catechol 2,3-dioxygenase-like lactoylglutathione lyase family enzyme
MGVKPTKDSIDLGIVTANGPAMFAFYRDVLGLEHAGDMPMPGGATMHRLNCGTTVVKIVVPTNPPAARPAPGGLAGGTGYRDFTITVEPRRGRRRRRPPGARSRQTHEFGGRRDR